MTASSSTIPVANNPEARKLTSYPALDWLRFALASIVVLNHESVEFFGPLDGRLAVEVFLALSGWLIGGILIRTEARELPRFFFNRATRIWLPYAGALILLYGVAALREGTGPGWFKFLFYDVTFTHYNFTYFPQAGATMPLHNTGNHFWSLSVEEQFYLFAPLLMFLVPWGKRPWPWLAIAVAAMVKGSPVASITLGVLAAITASEHGPWYLRRAGRIAVPLVTVAAFLLAWWWNVAVFRAIFAAGTVLALALPGKRRRLGLLLGAISYPFYLNHWVGAFVSHAVEHVVRIPRPVGVALAYGTALAVGAAAWAAIDRPVMLARDGWYDKTLGRRLGITAYALVAIGWVVGLVIVYNGGGAA